MVDSLEEALAIVFWSMVLTPVFYSLVGLGLAIRALHRPSQGSSIAAYAATVPLAAGSLLLFALGMSLHPGEGDRWLFPVSFGGSAALFALVVFGIFASHRAAHRVGARSPVTHPLGWGAMALAVLGALGFIAVSSD